MKVTVVGKLTLMLPIDYLLKNGVIRKIWMFLGFVVILIFMDIIMN